MPPVPEQTATYSRFAIDPVVPLRDAAFIVGCHPDTLKNAAKRGRIRLVKLSERRIGVRKTELNRYLDEGCAAA